MLPGAYTAGGSFPVIGRYFLHYDLSSRWKSVLAEEMKELMVTEATTAIAEEEICGMERIIGK